MILLLPKKCNTKQPIEEKQTIEQPVKEERIEHVHKTPLILTETKSFEFRADRRDYVDYNDAMEWCDSVSNIILDILKDNPEHFSFCHFFFELNYITQFQDQIFFQKLHTFLNPYHYKVSLHVHFLFLL